MVTFVLGNKGSITLTDAEHDALIKIGRPSSLEMIPQEALDGLARKGATHRRENGSHDLTDLGESMYHYVRKNPLRSESK